MRPKFEWILNAAFVALFLIVGAGVNFLAQFPLGAAVMGLMFYGGLAFLLISVWRASKTRKTASAKS